MPKHRNVLDRRRFLQASAAAALAGLLAACGQSVGRLTASPSPGQIKTPGLATQTPTSSPTASPMATYGEPFQSPFESVPPTGTEVPPAETAPPTPTPTPPPTPFPAGAPTKLGLFVEWYHPQIMKLIATGNVAVLKTLEFDPAFLADVKATSPETIIVGRATHAQLNLNQPDLLAEARRAVEAVLPLALDERRIGLVDAWEGFNEPVPGDEEQMRRLAELEAERVRLLSENGLRAVVGNFGTGQPPLEWWPAFRLALEATQAHQGYLGLHEYSAPTMWEQTTRPPFDYNADRADEGWLTLRYRKVYREYLNPWGLRLPLLITECGVDGMVGNRLGPPGKGWKDFAAYWAELGMGWDTPGNYVEQLAWYDQELQLDDYVHGAAIFAMTAFQEWESYQLQGEAASILKQYLSVHPLR